MAKSACSLRLEDDDTSKVAGSARPRPHQFINSGIVFRPYQINLSETRKPS
jgi:hypothetical protein